MRNRKALLENKRALLENKRAIPGNKEVHHLQENKGTSLEIKGHFWEVEGHINFRTRTVTTSLPLLEWSFLDVSIQNKISKIFLGAYN